MIRVRSALHTQSVESAPLFFQAMKTQPLRKDQKKPVLVPDILLMWPQEHYLLEELIHSRLHCCTAQLHKSLCQNARTFFKPSNEQDSTTAGNSHFQDWPGHSMALFQGKIIYPPPTPFLAIRHFSGEGGGGVYSEGLRGRNFIRPSSLYTPHP